MKILLVRVSSLGDVLHNLPMVADLLRHHPGATIDWVVEDGFAGLVRMNPHVRKIIPWSLRRWRKSLGKKETRAEIRAFLRTLREEEYDYVIDPQGLFKSGMIMGAARVKKGGRKIGMANRTEGSSYEGISRIFHTDSIALAPRVHAVARGRMLAATALGYGIDTPPDFGLPPPSPDTRPDFVPREDYAVFFHGTSQAAKKWAHANWVATGRALAPMPVLLPWGSEGERRDAEAIAAELPNARVLPKLPMMDAVKLAQHAALAVGVDTGLIHIAAAFVRPTVEIYMASHKWRTEGNWSERIVNLGQFGSAPSVDDVVTAARRLLEPR